MKQQFVFSQWGRNGKNAKILRGWLQFKTRIDDRQMMEECFGSRCSGPGVEPESRNCRQGEGQNLDVQMPQFQPIGVASRVPEYLCIAVSELAGLDPNFNAFDGFAIHLASQDLFADFWKDAVGQDGINDAPPTFHLCAPRINQANDLIVICQGRAMIHRNALLNASNLKFRDRANHFIVEREVGDDHQTTEQSRGEYLKQRVS